MPEPVKLTYLFIAEYTDGSRHTQTPEDRSKLEPDTRSEYYDVLQSGKTIKKFSLVNNNTVVAVDLETGLFYVNDLPLLLESSKLPTMPDKFDLIFYRQHTHNLNATYEKKTRELKTLTEGDHQIEYFIGWECKIAGKVYTQKLAVA